MSIQRESKGHPSRPETESNPRGPKVTRKRLWISKDGVEKRVYIDILLPECGVTLKNWALLCDLHDVPWEKSLREFARTIHLLPPMMNTKTWVSGECCRDKKAPVVRVEKGHRAVFRSAVLKAADSCPWKTAKARDIPPALTAAKPGLTPADLTVVMASAYSETVAHMAPTPKSYNKLIDELDASIAAYEESHGQIPEQPVPARLAPARQILM